MSMPWNPEIIRICRKFKTTKAVVEKADYFLRKLNRKTNGSMGGVDMLKYLVCVDLAFRDVGLKWDTAIANSCGLKSNQYHSTFTKISNKLNITKNKTISFQELAKHFRCSHIKGIFDKFYKQYQTKKFSELPIIQRQHTNLSTPVHKAAVFYVVATKRGKVKKSKKSFQSLKFLILHSNLDWDSSSNCPSIQMTVDAKALCDVMRCDRKKFEMMCADVKRTCFESTTQSTNQQTNSRKRSRTQMEIQSVDEETMNDAMFCDEYQSRRDRKHQQWKDAVAKENKKRRVETSKKSQNEGNKPKKMVIPNSNISSKKKGKPTKMFSIFDAAKKKKKKVETAESKEVEEEDEDKDIEEDIDLVATVINRTEQSEPNTKSKENKGENGGGDDKSKDECIGLVKKKDAEDSVKENKPLSARDRARMAALKRQEAMMKVGNPATTDCSKEINATNQNDPTSSANI